MSLLSDEATRGRVRARLESKRSVDRETGCWKWTGATTAQGYGETSIKGVFLYTHRAAAAIYLGAELTTRSLHVCHTCDTPACFNPDHLFLGTAADNQRDSREKGRTHVQRRRTTAAERELMRELRAEGAPYEEIARATDRSILTVIRYLNGKTFRTGLALAA